jgi:hypothetical protein
MIQRKKGKRVIIAKIMKIKTVKIVIVLIKMRSKMRKIVVVLRKKMAQKLKNQLRMLNSLINR